MYSQAINTDLKLKMRHCCRQLVCMLVLNQRPIDAKYGVDHLCINRQGRPGSRHTACRPIQ